MPRDLFDRDHKPYKNSKSYYKIGDSLSYGMGELSSQ